MSLCDVCYVLTGGRNLFRAAGADGDVCTRCHARREAGKWNRATALVQMHDSLTATECLCDRCGRLAMSPLPKIGDVCTKCQAVYVQARERAIEDIQLPASEVVTRTFLIPGWRRPTALEIMGRTIRESSCP